MNASEIKLDLLKKLDTLKGERLIEAYGVLLNFLNAEKDSEEWNKLTTEQQEAIKQGIEELNSGKGKAHDDVMNAMRNRYA